MKQLIILILLFAIGSSGYSQGTILYNQNGQLKINPFYTIDVELLNTIGEIEKALPSIYYDIEYTELALENGIQGTVIARVEVIKALDTISCEIVKSSVDILGKYVEHAIIKNQSHILAKSKLNETFYFYLPVIFEYDEFQPIEDLKKHRAIRVYRHYLPLRKSAI